MAPDVLESFFESPRPTSLPYASWLTGQRLLLLKGRDFNEECEAVRIKLLAYAKRHDWAAVAILARRPIDPLDGPALCLQVWGDPSRSWDEGPPDEIWRELKRTPRRKRRVSS